MGHTIVFNCLIILMNKITTKYIKEEIENTLIVNYFVIYYSFN